MLLVRLIGADTRALVCQVAPAAPMASAGSTQPLLDGLNADANERFEAFLRSDERRNARELRDGEDEVHIPVPEEGVDYGGAEYVPNVTMLTDFQPDPQEVL